MADERENGRRILRIVPGGGAAARAREDDALLSAFLVGDEEAFGELVRRHQDLVLRIVRRYARTPDDARDLAQRTFVRAYEASRRFLARRRDPAVPFRRWLVRIAVNLSKNHLRDETRWTRAPLEAVDDASPQGPHPAPDEAISRAQDEVRMRRAVLGLPRRQREVLTLRIDAELPFAEIAEALGITENAAKVSFHHAARRLRALLEEDGK